MLLSRLRHNHQQRQQHGRAAASTADDRELRDAASGKPVLALSNGRHPVSGSIWWRHPSFAIGYVEGETTNCDQSIPRRGPPVYHVVRVHVSNRGRQRIAGVQPYRLTELVEIQTLRFGIHRNLHRCEQAAYRYIWAPGLKCDVPWAHWWAAIGTGMAVVHVGVRMNV